MRERVRRFLAWGVLLAVLLPMVIAVVLGPGAAACGRVGLVIGVAWFLALAATATASGIVVLEASASSPERSGRQGRPERPDGLPADE